MIHLKNYLFILYDNYIAGFSRNLHGLHKVTVLAIRSVWIVFSIVNNFCNIMRIVDILLCVSVTIVGIVLKLFTRYLIFYLYIIIT